MNCFTAASFRYIHSAQIHVQPSPSAWSGSAWMLATGIRWLAPSRRVSVLLWSPCCVAKENIDDSTWRCPGESADSRAGDWLLAGGCHSTLRAEHHLFRDCCDANKGGHWGSAVGITRGVEAEILLWERLPLTPSSLT